jgi:prepilin-type N-terminal cleavage/methylation domain-containing protein
MLIHGVGVRRGGVTLVELIVALAISGVVLSLITSISVRQQRIYADLADAAALSGQLREAAAILPTDLRGAASSSGDIRSGEARDTAIEFRGTIASAVVCDTTASGVLLAPAGSGVTGFASFLIPIEAGDTAWVYSAREALDEWRPYRVASVASTAHSAATCAPLGPTLTGSERSAARIAIELDAGPPPAGTVGAPVRFTRVVRYSLYRAADGEWYLGARDWNPAAARFNTIQPVSGPFLSPSLGGLAFHYLDTLGVSLATPVLDTRAISLVRIELRGQTKNAARALSAGGPPGKRSDSLSLVVLLRNRR